MGSNIKKNFYSDNALDWLNGLFAERYDLKGLLLSRDKNFKFILTFEENKSIISFPPSPDSLWNLDEDCPFATIDLSDENLDLPFDNNIPVPGYKESNKLFERRNGDFYFNVDLIGIIFWALCRVEELGKAPLDRHGRYQFSSSHAYKFNYLMRPFVDEYFFIIGRVIDEIWPDNKRRKNKFKFSISHDVDAPAKYPRNNFFLIIRSLTINLLKANFKECRVILKVLSSKYYLLSTYDSYNQFDWIMSKSEEFDLKSTFYFISGKTSRLYDGDYQIRDEAMKNLIRSIHFRGHKIGVHFSYNSWKSKLSLKNEIKKLRDLLIDEKIYQEELGSRMHYLRWIFPDTLKNLEEAGTNYDATVTHAGHPGFRAGTCFSYKAFDPIKGKKIDLEIRPLVAMENSILSKKYMNIGIEQKPEDIFYELINSCINVGGTFSLLWHNSDLQFPEQRDLYCRVLEYVDSKKIYK